MSLSLFRPFLFLVRSPVSSNQRSNSSFCLLSSSSSYTNSVDTPRQYEISLGRGRQSCDTLGFSSDLLEGCTFLKSHCCCCFSSFAERSTRLSFSFLASATHRVCLSHVDGVRSFILSSSKPCCCLGGGKYVFSFQQTRRRPAEQPRRLLLTFRRSRWLAIDSALPLRGRREVLQGM